MVSQQTFNVIKQTTDKLWFSDDMMGLDFDMADVEPQEELNQYLVFGMTQTIHSGEEVYCGGMYGESIYGDDWQEDIEITLLAEVNEDDVVITELERRKI